MTNLAHGCPNCGAGYYAEGEQCQCCGHGEPPEDLCDFVPDAEMRGECPNCKGAVDSAEIVSWLRGRTGYGGGFTCADDVADAIERRFITDRGR